jgi:transcriptional regulator with XRE-family HTH domain
MVEFCECCGHSLGPPMARAIRRAMGRAGFATQAELVEATGLHPSEISDFLKGKREPLLPKIALIDKACGMPRGWILRAAGYVDDGPSEPTR